MTNSSNAQQPLPPVFVTIWVFYEQRKQFKLDPPFQRKRVWTKVQKEAFIDTLLRGDPIPPLEAYEEVSEDGVRTFIVLNPAQKVQLNPKNCLNNYPHISGTALIASTSSSTSYARLTMHRYALAFCAFKTTPH